MEMQYIHYVPDGYTFEHTTIPQPHHSPTLYQLGNPEGYG